MSLTGSHTVDPQTGLPIPPAPIGFALGLCGAAMLTLLFGLVVGMLPTPKPAAGGAAAVATGPGDALYASSCTACHGPKGEKGVGKALTTAVVQGMSDAELFDVIEKGRSVDDPKNTSKVPMPAKGGNATLSADDVKAIVVTIRGFSAGAKASSGAGVQAASSGGSFFGKFGRLLLFFFALGGAGLISATARQRR